MQARAFLEASVTLVVASAAGGALDFMGVPLGWLVGAMLAMSLAAFTRLPARQPRVLMPWVRACVGTLLGASVTAGFLAAFGDWWVSLVAMLGLMALVARINQRMLQRAFGFTSVDATLCAVPGGITEMILLSEQAGADQVRVAVTHALRIALAIVLVPLLAAMLHNVEIRRAASTGAVMSAADWLWFGLCVLSGVMASRLRHLPAPFIIVPGTLCAALHLSGLTQFSVPSEVNALVQILIGINVGARFQNLPLARLAQIASAAVAVVLVQIAGAVLGAGVVSRLTGLDPLGLLLAYSPGGLAEMSLIAIAMGREVALVGFHHLLRVLFALFAAPLFLKTSIKRP